MKVIADLPAVVPVFPLPGALLLPRARLPLQVFEPRYLAMLEDVLKTPHRLIGMVQPFARADDSSRLHAIGCAGRVTAFSETDDGRYMITLTGVSRFRITQEVEGFTPYRRCDVNWAGFDSDFGAAEKDPAFDRAPFLKMLGRFLDDKGLSTDWDSLGEAEDELLINSLAMLCPFAPEDKQALLEAPSLRARRETLTTLIQFALSGGSGDEILQ
ncbi:hypothetical protein SAMN04488005_2931 [Yoonia tamlensis]|uniref:Lon N-terminal domain-containing protein n=1 Tax=Yoonia tamlensis TaxID=390270 RepID=A0A1I6HPV8_9RHOB|nr:LON peptidase substrate-binding domain-containing protein [Yoonia tamlensis]SFR56493.1 hypothetical protein SAMN04488005_2931 [Yoonia tamlensis]